MKVAIIKKDDLDYCREAPFHPQEPYPEYPFHDLSERNSCYAEVRNLFRGLGLDRDNYGKKSWNPLGEVIRPGDRIFIKPNMVTHENKVGGTDAVITHGSVIRAVLDYVYIALKGEGSIVIGDAPYINTDFNKVLEFTGTRQVAEYYQTHSSIGVQVIDLRKETGPLKLGRIKKRELNSDPLGYAVVDLKSDSEHAGFADEAGRYRAAFYDRNEMLSHHTGDKNEYLIARSVLAADVVINIPKLKTHAKTGITCALKNLVGINGAKGWLPHHRAGPGEKGGDEYQYSDLRKDLFTRIKDDIPASRSIVTVLPLRATQSLLFASKMIVPFRDNYDAGGWHGNHTLPRTIADLNRILYYADQQGVMSASPQRRMFIVVDGIVAGEKEGPMANGAKRCGVLVAGSNPIAVDMVCSAVMGFDYRKIHTFKYVTTTSRYPLIDGAAGGVQITDGLCHSLDDIFHTYSCHLTPPDGWKGHIEYVPDQVPGAPLPVPAGGHA